MKITFTDGRIRIKITLAQMELVYLAQRIFSSEFLRTLTTSEALQEFVKKLMEGDVGVSVETETGEKTRVTTPSDATITEHDTGNMSKMAELIEEEVQKNVKTKKKKAKEKGTTN